MPVNTARVTAIAETVRRNNTPAAHAQPDALR